MSIKLRDNPGRVTKRGKAKMNKASRRKRVVRGSPPKLVCSKSQLGRAGLGWRRGKKVKKIRAGPRRQGRAEKQAQGGGAECAAAGRRVGRKREERVIDFSRRTRVVFFGGAVMYVSTIHVLCGKKRSLIGGIGSPFF